MKYIEVVAAVIKNSKNEFFCARRKDDGELALKWEFPGGKVEHGETHQDALIREIKEEFNIDIVVKEYIETVKHQYVSFHITLHAYHAEITNGNMILVEHTGSKWLKAKDLLSLDWAEADIPIVQLLKSN